jgi:hypothetical protein
MKRNGIGHHLNVGRSSRRTSERNGKFVHGPAKGRMGKAKGGRVKRSRY